MTTRINIKHTGPNSHRATVVTNHTPPKDLSEGESCEHYVYDTQSVFVHESTVDTETALRSLLAKLEAKAKE